MSSVRAEPTGKDRAARAGRAEGGARRRRTGRVARIALPAVTLVVLIALWQAGLFHRALGLQPYPLAYPSDVVDTLRTDSGTLLPATLTTVLEALAGFGLGSASGFLLAILLCEFGVLRRSLLPMLSGLVSMPIIALAPLMVL